MVSSGRVTDPVASVLSAPRSVPPWYCLHQERECPVEARRSRSSAFRVSQAHYDKIMRWDDQCRLASRTCHVVCVPGHRKSAVTVDPEEAAVDRASVGFPGGCDRATNLAYPCGKSAHRSKPRPEDTDFQDVPSRVRKRVRILVQESSQKDRSLSPSSGYRACQKVPDAGTTGTAPRVSPHRAE